MFAQRWGVLVEVVDVDLVDVLLDVDVNVLLDVNVDVLVEVDVVLVVVSHPLQVLSHCSAMESVKHSPTTKKRSHLARGNVLCLSAHL